MHIIGTAGHVDHGKTSLIRALTGIDADRLPEEKKRGMTIDLGFAHFEGKDGEPVGVIDVPGHERFIRNMVAGAWSLSCAVIVVAGNEGWMQQTEDHARVLEAMNIGEIVCAVTKSDITPEDTLHETTEEARRNLLRIFEKEIGIIHVSSHTGDGIDRLKRAVMERLDSLPERTIRGSGYVHVDRVFSVKGAGTIITGSLSGGTLSEGDEITFLPSGRKSRIRGIQSYYSPVKTAYPVSRVACNCAGIGKEDISRGCVAVKAKEDFQTEQEFIIRWEQYEKKRNTVKNHMELELACGTGHYTGRIHFLRIPGFARIVMNSPVPVSFLSPFLFIQQGGHRIVGKGNFIWAGKTDRHFRIKLSSLLGKYPVPERIDNETLLRFLLREWYTPDKDNDRKAIEEFAAAEKCHISWIGETVLLTERLLKEQRALRESALQRGGIQQSEYLDSGELPRQVKEILVRQGVEENDFIHKDQLLISPDQIGEKTELSPHAKEILRLLSKQKNRGLQLKEITEPGTVKELRHLVRIGKVVALEGDIYFSTGYFSKLTREILEGLEPGAAFSIPDAKEKTGLTRRYIIPVLNRMEGMGLVERRGDVRIVAE